MVEEKKPICTIALVAVNVIVFFWLSFGGRTEDAFYMLNHGAMYTPYIVEGHQYYRLFTCMFMHFGFPHLMNNMVVLAVLGCNLEPVIGKVRMIMLYILSGLGGNLLSLTAEMLLGGSAISAGASGAVFGFTGALLCLAVLNHGTIGNVTKQGMFAMTAISLYMGFTSEGVDNFAHIGGLLTGIVVTILFCWKRNFKRSSLIDN